MDRFPYAEHLSTEEVDYELLIRGQLEGRVCELDLTGKQRLLRTLFKADAKNGQNYRAPFNISEEFSHISGRVGDLSKSIIRLGVEPRFESRLYHYWYRAKRCQTVSEDQKRMRRELVRRIEDCMRENRVGPPTADFKDRINEMLNSESAKGVTGRSPGAETGAIPKTSSPGHQNTSARQNRSGEQRTSTRQLTPTREDYNEMQRRLDELERKYRETLAVRSPSRRVGTDAVTRRHLRDTTSSDEELDHQTDERCRGRHDGRRQTERVREQRWSNRRHGTSDRDRDSSGGSNFSRELRGGRSQRPDRRNHHEEGRDHSYRVEKWKLKFTGDPRSISVENFLYKLKKIAEREGVSDGQLLRDIHLLLENSASDWFFTFVDDFDDWETFEKLIRYRFGNPNQDQGIRQKIQERKQLRGESFIAFVTAIEKLNRLLSKPLSRNRKFEVIWDNMRQHYRSKISIIEVKDLQHLLKLNYRIDAADLHLQQAWEPQPRRSINNLDVDDSGEESEEQTDINVVRMRSYREGQRQPPGGIQQSSQQPQGVGVRTEQPTTVNMALNPRLCWNCQQEGHGWRECNRPKVIFCYGCGNLGRTIRCCERCAARQRTSNTHQGNL